MGRVKVDGSMKESWFAVRTRSRAEKSVQDQLERKGVEVFLPTATRWSRWKDRKKAVDWPVFPGYCFARFDPANHLTVLKCFGVASIVAFGNFALIAGIFAPMPTPRALAPPLTVMLSTRRGLFSV